MVINAFSLFHLGSCFKPFSTSKNINPDNWIIFTSLHTLKMTFNIKKLKHYLRITLIMFIKCSSGPILTFNTSINSLRRGATLFILRVAIKCSLKYGHKTMLLFYTFSIFITKKNRERFQITSRIIRIYKGRAQMTPWLRD
jgi:hypothetical protein